MPRVVKDDSVDPITGMRNMSVAIVPGDRVVLITGEDHRLVSDVITAKPGYVNLTFRVWWRPNNWDSLGWAILDSQGRVEYWKWLEIIPDPGCRDYIQVALRQDGVEFRELDDDTEAS